MTMTQEAPVHAPSVAPPARPRWVRPSVVALLAGTALLYLWNLGASGWANSFYAAAVQAGSASWKAFFFGSSDASNFITVDKTPASLWVMEISARVFGLNAWSLLVPQALEGVAAVGLLYLTVRRWYGPAAGLIAGACFALTPVAVLMFRFNNPDALLVLLLVAAAYATTRAVEAASAKWLMLAGALVGFGFLTKMLQAFLVIPAFAVVYLIAAPTSMRRRLLHLLYAGGALVVAGGWWVAIVSMIPASDRPYIGGSQNNSVLELALGYNGLGRLTGDEAGSVTGGAVTGGAVTGGAGAGPGGNAGGMWGSTGWTRLFGSDTGGQAAWLLPAALILLAGGLWAAGRAARTSRMRAGFIIWGGWLLVTGLTFSFMKGIFHPYYLVALAPAIGAVVGMGVVTLWRMRSRPAARLVLAAATAASAVTGFVLLRRSTGWHPWLPVTVLVVGLLAAAGLAAMRALAAQPLRARAESTASARSGRPATRVAVVLAAVALIVALAGPGAYALNTASTPHTGSIPSAGPSSGGFGGPGGGPGWRGGFPGGGQGTAQGGRPGFGGPPNGFGGLPGAQNGGTQNGGAPNGGAQAGGAPGGGGQGGLLDAGTPQAALVSALESNASDYKWVAASVGSNNAAGLQLATRLPVMSIGGFNGSDPSPTLAQFQALVKAGEIHYFVGGGGFGGQSGGSQSANQIAQWVASTYTAKTIGGQTVYDLTSGATS